MSVWTTKETRYEGEEKLCVVGVCLSYFFVFGFVTLVYDFCAWVRKICVVGVRERRGICFFVGTWDS